MNKILVLSRGESDLTRLISQNCPTACILDYTHDCVADILDFDAVAVLGGNRELPLVLHAPIRQQVEQMRAAGKPVFCEYTHAIGNIYHAGLEEKTHDRLVYGGQVSQIPGLQYGDLLDGHWNSWIWYPRNDATKEAILSYHPYICAHDHVDMSQETYQTGKHALWKLDDNTMVCAFQLSNFRKARLAPRENWEKVISYILSFLAGEERKLRFPEPVCRYETLPVESYQDAARTVQKGLSWIENAGILCDNGKRGVFEGLTHLIRAYDGYQKPAPEIRTDCSGEIGGAFMMDWLLTGKESSRKRFEALEDFCFGDLQVKEGLHKGMIRWSENCWHICYQDDVARVILPTLLCQNFTKEGSRHFADAVDACRYLLKTTGKNGLRISVTDSFLLTEEKMQQLRDTNSGTSRAHHNGYYAAVLLLAYRAGAPKAFFEVAERGLRTIMELYPDNEREHSQTQELCRLVLPLSVLYEISKSAEHKKWLDLVLSELDKVYHESGAYREWDTGYKANRARQNADECSLLAHNGDQIADLLYSVNWLPLGFAYAYYATGDERLKTRWNRIASFMASCQANSEDPLLDGSWARAFDLERREVYGVPHDIGWAPCCVESGWTVAEILMGLQFMGLTEKQSAGMNF